MSQYAICLDKVSFAYGEMRVLREVSLTVRQGEHIGILGESGSGKSTILKLLAGLYEPDSGEIWVAGESAPEAIRTKVAMVMQQNSLFPVSIRENITCGHETSEKAVWEACAGASLTDWIKSLPEGLNTKVGERGGQVSGGQAQRIQIARAIYKNAPIVLLDEPTSALDAATRQTVITALDCLMAGKTVVHVTHHPEVLRSSDTVYRLEGGKLIHA